MNLGIILATKNVVHQAQTWCEMSENNDHTSDTCIANPKPVNYVGNINHQGDQNFRNSYNPNCWNHPNFSWGGNQIKNANQYQGPINQNQQQHAQGN